MKYFELRAERLFSGHVTTTPYSTVRKAKRAAEREHGSLIDWMIRPDGVVTSGDLRTVMYTITETKIL
jgi:hypothetical protein